MQFAWQIYCARTSHLAANCFAISYCTLPKTQSAVGGATWCALCPKFQCSKRPFHDFSKRGCSCLALCIKFISRAAFRPTCDARANMRASESDSFTFIVQPHYQQDFCILWCLDESGAQRLSKPLTKRKVRFSNCRSYGKMRSFSLFSSCLLDGLVAFARGYTNHPPAKFIFC